MRIRGRSIVASGFAAALLALLAAPNCGGDGKGTPPDVKVDNPNEDAAAERVEFELVAFGRVLGTIAPCGCTTEPLGGLQYAFGWLEASPNAKARVVVEPGSFLYPDPAGPYAPPDEAGWAQAESRAKLLADRFAKLGTALVSGIGPLDAVAPTGTSAITTHALPRVAANLEPASGITIAKHRIVPLESSGVKWSVGVTEVLDPQLAGVDKLGKVAPAAAALRSELDAMKAAGSQYHVVVAHGSRAFAESLASEVPGIGAIVVGVVEGTERQRVGTPAAQKGSTWILEPGEQLQTVSRLVLSIDGSAKAVPESSTWTVAPSASELARELARIEARLEKFKADPSADPAFIARLEDERSKALAAKDGKVEGPAVVTFEQVKVTCKLKVDDEAKQALAAYDHAVAENNRARFTGKKPPPPAKGKAGYVGIDGCADCHEEAVAQWKTTVHAGAWQTLVDDKKDLDLSCVSCHVTGFRKPGGSELVENMGLRDVQCEVCHGPGSLHVADGGADTKLIQLVPTADLCAGECHTAEHSDTFDYVPYLRDVLGKGHGEAARAKLGDGPTGAELRAAGLAKAGGACKKM
jgi:hypothetical protein